MMQPAVSMEQPDNNRSTSDHGQMLSNRVWHKNHSMHQEGGTKVGGIKRKRSADMPQAPRTTTSIDNYIINSSHGNSDSDGIGSNQSNLQPTLPQNTQDWPTTPSSPQTPPGSPSMLGPATKRPNRNRTRSVESTNAEASLSINASFHLLQQPNPPPPPHCSNAEFQATNPISVVNPNHKVGDNSDGDARLPFQSNFNNSILNHNPNVDHSNHFATQQQQQQQPSVAVSDPHSSLLLLPLHSRSDIHNRPIQLGLCLPTTSSSSYTTSSSSPSLAIDHVVSRIGQDSSSSSSSSSSSPSPSPSPPSPPPSTSTLPLTSPDNADSKSDPLSQIPTQTQPNLSVTTIQAQGHDDLLSSPAPSHRTRKMAAVRAPPASLLSKSSCTTSSYPAFMIPPLFHTSLDASAASTRASTPTLSACFRDRRKRKDRATVSVTPVSAIPSLEPTDRRRSGRIAKATASSSGSDSSALSNLGLFGFSPFLENLVLGGRENERRTRSGIRPVRQTTDKPSGRSRKTAAAAAKGKDKEQDGPDDEIKKELYHQLCILSYQLQAELGTVPFKTLDQLKAELSNPLPTGLGDDTPSNYPSEQLSIKPEPEQDGRLSGQPIFPVNGMMDQGSNQTQIGYVPMFKGKGDQIISNHPTSSHESASIASLYGIASARSSVKTSSPSIDQNSAHARQGDPMDAVNSYYAIDQEPLSPILRPARPNIMSISALISGPVKARTRIPSPPIHRSTPSAVLEWTQEDELASEVLQGLLGDNVENASQSVQLPSKLDGDNPTISGISTPAEQVFVKSLHSLDPYAINPLDQVDLEQVFLQEDEEYAKEKDERSELYLNMRYLEHFDQVIDRWRTEELTRLRREAELKKLEIQTLWVADRKATWCDFNNERAATLLWENSFKTNHQKWQATSDLNRIQYHKPKTRVLAKATSGLFDSRKSYCTSASLLPAAVEGKLKKKKTTKTVSCYTEDHTEREKERKVENMYHVYGSFLNGAKYSALQDPRVRSDIAVLKRALRDQRMSEKAAVEQGQTFADETHQQDAEGGQTVDLESDDEIESDSACESELWSEISSLPSFSSFDLDLNSEADPEIYGYQDGNGNRWKADRKNEPIADTNPNIVLSWIDVGQGRLEESSDEDESLLSRQMRMSSVATIASHSGSTPLVSLQPIVSHHASFLSLSSSPSPPLLSPTIAGDEENGQRKRKKPPPPGVRLWKAGRVQAPLQT